MKTGKKVFLCVICSLLIIVIYTVIDSFNILTKIVPPISNLNPDFYSIFFGAVLSILGYIVTYILIDKRQKEKEDNAKNTANLFLNDSYKECQQWISWSDDKSLWKSMISHVDYNALGDEATNRISKAPFSFDEEIIGFACNGVISADDYQKYMIVKSAYSKYINVKITFPDVPKVVKTARDELDKSLEDAANKNVD